MPTVEGERVRLPRQKITLYARDWGGSGPPVLLLHGLSSNSRIWDWVAPRLIAGFRVIALDQRGHGQADVPEDGYGFDDTSADLAEFAEIAGLERPLIVGHSWGASVALSFAAAYPEKARGIALVDGGFMSPSAHMTWQQAEQVMRPPDIPGVPVADFLAAARSWPNIGALWTDELGEMLLANFEVREGRVHRRLPTEKHMLAVRALYDLQAAEVMPGVRCPALLIPAVREPANAYEKAWADWREAGIAEAQRLLTDARVQRMEDSIHDVPLQRPAELAAAIEAFGRGLS